jgi:hypothetical protein
MLLHAMADFLETTMCTMYAQKKLQRYFLSINIPIFITVIAHSVGAGRAYRPVAPFWESSVILIAGAAVFALLTIVELTITLYLFASFRKIQYRERRILITVGVCMPFLVASVSYLNAVAIAGPIGLLSPLSNWDKGVFICGWLTTVPDLAILVVCFWLGCSLKLAETNPAKAGRIQGDRGLGTEMEVSREMAAGHASIYAPPPYAVEGPLKEYASQPEPTYSPHHPYITRHAV